jgi:hypothetical protein
VRLAIAAWERGASWRDRGWAGENNAAATEPCTHRWSANSTTHLYGAEGTSELGRAIICMRSGVGKFYCFRANIRLGTSNANRNWTAQYSWMSVPR